MKSWLMLLCLTISPLANANGINCTSTLRDAWIDGSGLLLVHPYWANKSVGLCNVTTKHNNIEPEVCKSWVSIALTAVTAQKSTIIQYHTIDACSEIDSYSNSQQASYFMLRSE